MWPLGFDRYDLWLWLGALAAGAVGTIIAWAAGARLGAALTLGVVLLVVGVVGGIVWQERRRRFPGVEPRRREDAAPTAPRPRPATRGRQGRPGRR